jgi:hypothetical protein
MAAFARSTPQIDVPERVSEEIANGSAIARLAALHAEAEETARLANLLGRSLYAAIALAALALLTLGFTDGASVSRQLVWCAFIAAASLVMLRAYRRTIGQPFERVALKSFAEDMSAILLFSGFAWGAGGFLVLSPGTGFIAALLFVAVPAIAIAALLREPEAVFLFLAPMAVLTSFASVLMPFASGALGSGLILIACAAIAGAAVLADRRRAGEFIRPAMLPLT